MIDLDIVKSVNGISLSEKLHGASTIDTSRNESREVEFRNGEIFFNTDSLLQDGGSITFGTDITELKHREKAMKQLQEAIQEVPGPIRIMLWDKDDKLIITNNFVKERMGEFGLQMIPGVTTSDQHRHHLLDNGYIKSINGEAIVNGSLPSSYRKTSKGSVAGLREIEFKNGEITLMEDGLLEDGSKIVFGTDITERKNREKNLIQLQEAIEAAPISISLFDKDDTLILANKFVRERMESIGFQMIPGKTLDLERRRYLFENKIIKSINGKTLGKDFAIDDVTKHDLDENMRVREVEFSNGVHSLMESTYLNDGSHISFGLDITELKKREKSMRQLQMAIDATPARIMLWDKNEQLIMANEFIRNKF